MVTLNGRSLQVQKAAVSAVRDLSQKAIAAAESANARAVEGELSLDRIEANLGVQLHEITRTQVNKASVAEIVVPR